MGHSSEDLTKDSAKLAYVCEELLGISISDATGTVYINAHQFSLRTFALLMLQSQLQGCKACNSSVKCLTK